MAPLPMHRDPDEQGLELERTRLWPRVWLCAGRASDAATPGSYFTFELGREVLLVVNDAGKLRAFYNVCQHRGHPLRPCGRGTARALRCPYHGWTYSLAGRLEHVPDRDSFPGQAPAEEFSLEPLPCEQRAGFVWVHFGAAQESVDDFLAELLPALGASGLDAWSLTGDATFELAANWKAALEVEQAEPDYQLHAQHSHARRLAHTSYRIFPNLTLNVGERHADVYRSRPHATDSQRSWLDVWRLERGPSQNAGRPLHQTWANDDGRLPSVLAELRACNERIHHGQALVERTMSR